MADYLDPKLDVVFKLLFTRELELLRSMLEAILGETIEEVRIMSPELLGDRSGDKGVVMDVRVALPSKRADVEMQGQDHTALAERLLFYGTRDYTQQLRKGGRWEELTPTVVVAWLVEPLFENSEEFHTIFELRSRSDGRLYSEHLSIHVLELSRIPKDGAALPSVSERAVVRWARFLTARTEQEYEELAMEDPIMDAAKQALERLSLDPEAVRIAQEREDELKLDRIERAKAIEKGVAKGVQEAVEKAVQEARVVQERAVEKAAQEARVEANLASKRDAVFAVLEARGRTLSEEQRTRIATCSDAETLDDWLRLAARVETAGELFSSVS